MTNDIVGLSRTSGIEKKKFEIDPINDYIWNEYLNTEFFKLGEIIYSEYNDMDFLDKINKPKDIDQLKKESERLAQSIEKLRDSKLLGNILLQESNSFNHITEEDAYIKLKTQQTKLIMLKAIGRVNPELLQNEELVNYFNSLCEKTTKDIIKGMLSVYKTERRDK